MLWPTKKLEEISVKITDGSHAPPKVVENGEMMLSSRNIYENGIIFQNYRNISKTDFEFENKRTDVSSGDVLFTCVGSIGRCVVVPEGAPKFVLQRSVAVIKPNQQLNSKYLAYCLKSPLIQERVLDKARGAAQQGIYLKDIKNLEIPLPPIEIQKKIVKKIEELFEKIDGAQKMRELATQDTNKFIASLIDEALEKNPDWQNKKLREVVEIQTNRNTTVDLPYVGMEDVSSGGTTEFYGNMEPRVVRSTTYYFDQNHVLYGKLRPYLNKLLLPHFVGHCTTEFLPLKPDDRYLIREWLALWLRSQKTVDRIMETTTGARMPRADMKRVADFNVPLPSIDEQKKIVARLDALTSKVRELQRLQAETAEDLKSLKQSILHQAFKGELVA